jgi:Helicase associated domain
LGNDSKLKPFADHQRARRKAGKLLKEREALLDEIGFPGNPHDEMWEEMYEQLCESIKTGSSPDKRLRSWMINQRTEFATGRLIEDRIKRLSGVGFCWNLRQERWRKRFEQLREYHSEHGDCLGHKAEKPASVMD